jgi:hypothetical protein
VRVEREKKSFKLINVSSFFTPPFFPHRRKKRRGEDTTTTTTTTMEGGGATGTFMSTSTAPTSLREMMMRASCTPTTGSFQGMQFPTLDTSNHGAIQLVMGVTAGTDPFITARTLNRVKLDKDPSIDDLTKPRVLDLGEGVVRSLNIGLCKVPEGSETIHVGFGDGPTLMDHMRMSRVFDPSSSGWNNWTFPIRVNVDALPAFVGAITPWSWLGSLGCVKDCLAPGGSWPLSSSGFDPTNPASVINLRTYSSMLSSSASVLNVSQRCPVDSVEVEKGDLRPRAVLSLDNSRSDFRCDNIPPAWFHDQSTPISMALGLDALGVSTGVDDKIHRAINNRDVPNMLRSIYPACLAVGVARRLVDPWDRIAVLACKRADVIAREIAIKRFFGSSDQPRINVFDTKFINSHARVHLDVNLGQFESTELNATSVINMVSSYQSREVHRCRKAATLSGRLVGSVHAMALYGASNGSNNSSNMFIPFHVINHYCDDLPSTMVDEDTYGSPSERVADGSAAYRMAMCARFLEAAKGCGGGSWEKVPCLPMDYNELTSFSIRGHDPSKVHVWEKPLTMEEWVPLAARVRILKESGVFVRSVEPQSASGRQQQQPFQGDMEYDDCGYRYRNNDDDDDDGDSWGDDVDHGDDDDDDKGTRGRRRSVDDDCNFMRKKLYHMTTDVTTGVEFIMVIDHFVHSGEIRCRRVPFICHLWEDEVCSRARSVISDNIATSAVGRVHRNLDGMLATETTNDIMSTSTTTTTTTTTTPGLAEEWINWLRMSCEKFVSRRSTEEEDDDDE